MKVMLNFKTLTRTLKISTVLKNTDVLTATLQYF